MRTDVANDRTAGSSWRQERGITEWFRAMDCDLRDAGAQVALE